MAMKKTTKTTAKVSKPAPAAKKASPAKACCVAEPKAKAAPRKAKAAVCAEAACACTEEACVCAAQPAAKKAKAAAPKTTRVAFSVRAEVGSKVFLAGCFNGWDPTAKQMIDKEGTGVFTCALNLPKGKYEYKFVINGTWCADPECTDWVQNDMGTLNSVKIVG